MKRRGKSSIQVTSLAVVMTALSACTGGAETSVAGDQNPNPGGSNTPPTISGTPPLNISVGESYSFTPTASDADGDSLTFSIVNLPAWGSFDTDTGTLSGSPTSGDAGSYADVVISVSDGSASRSLAGFAIDVAEIGNLSKTLSWTPPTQNADNSPLIDLAAYKFYYGLSEGNYPNEIYIDSPGISSYTVENLTANTYYFVATAINRAGAESDYSNVAIWNAE